MKIASRIYDALVRLIMGQKPYHTIFAFNYHNTRHIACFMEYCAENVVDKLCSIVDVGAGASPYYPIFEDVAWTYEAVDLVEALPEVETRDIEQRVGIAEELPINSASVETVLCNQVLEHVTDEREAVHEAFRVLRPGGYFIGSVPHISPVHLEPHDYRRFTRYGLEMLLKDAGFEVVRIEGSGGPFQAAALTLLMDLYLSKVGNGPQRFNAKLHNALFLFNGAVNLFAALLDKLIGDKGRSPANYCWIARKPKA